MTSNKSCQHCSTSLTAEAKFCPSCGKSLLKPAIRTGSLPKLVLGSLTLGACIYYSLSQIGLALAGTAPTDHYKAPVRKTEARSNPHNNSELLDELRFRAKEDANNIEHKIRLATELSKLATAQMPVKTSFVHEAIEVLRKAKTLDASNIAVRMLLADSYFSLQSFNEAISEYKEILPIDGADKDAVESKLASTHAFMGNFDEAISLLTSVLERSPKNFQALAYLAIAHSQKGDRKAAIQVGRKALEAAPTQEARMRFSAFYKTLNPQDAQPKSSGNTIVDFISNNAVAGPKFVSHEITGSTLKLYFKDFPMQAMPQMAKDKFYLGIKNLSSSEIALVEFIDLASGKIMDSLPLGK